MKKTILLATAPMALALTACGGEAVSGEEGSAAIDADDNDTPEPIADDHQGEGDDHEHPEGTDPSHSH